MKTASAKCMRAACLKHGHVFLGKILVTRPCGMRQTLTRFKCGNCGRKSQNHWTKIVDYCRRCSTTVNKSRDASEFKDRLHSFGHTLVRIENPGKENKAVFRCGTCGGTSRAAFQDIASKFCKGCSPRFHSKNEDLLAELLQLAYPSLLVVRNDKKLLRSLGASFKAIRELDVVMYSEGKVRLVVEWNGKHWHSDPRVAAKDAEKAALLAAHNVPFVVIEDPAGHNREFVIDSIVKYVVPLLGLPAGTDEVAT